MSLTSMGYDSAANPTTYTRTVIGMTRLRHPYPDVSLFEDESGTNTVLRLVLSDYVFQKDSNLTLTVAQGLYTLGAVSNNSGSVTVTNQSTNAYPKVIGNNSWPPYEMATNSTYPVRVLAFHWSAYAGKPVECVRFVATDGTLSLTNIVTAPTINDTVNDAVPFAEYIWSVPLDTGLKSSNLITVNWQAYPRIGDSSAVMDTTDGVYALPHRNYSPTAFYNNYSNTYLSAWANVDTNGSDATGIAMTNWAWTTNVTPFATINGAASAIAASNNAWFGRNDIGGGRIHLQAQEHKWTGSNRTMGTIPQTYCVITKMPHMAVVDGIIYTNQGAAGNTDLSDMVKVQEIKIANTGPFGCFNYIRNLWIDQCYIDDSGSATVYINTNVYFTANDFYKITGHIRKNASAGDHYNLIRGNYISHTNDLYVTVSATAGNLKTNNTTSNLIIVNEVGMSQVASAILYNNKFLRTSNTTLASATFSRQYTNTWIGVAMIQNLVETRKDNNNGWAMFTTYDTNPVHNVLMWHNTVAGLKSLWYYNWTGTDLSERHLVWNKNNIWEEVNIKTDDNPTESGNRIGNWGPNFGVGCSGTLMPEVYNINGASEFPHEYFGLRSYGTNGTSTNLFIAFVDRQAFSVTNAWGYGDYHLQAGSPAIAAPVDFVLNFDIDGSARASNDAAGVFTYP